jgi:hypothetical protein
VPIDSTHTFATVKLSLLLTMSKQSKHPARSRGNGRRLNANSALAPHCGIGFLGLSRYRRKAAPADARSFPSKRNFPHNFHSVIHKDSNHVVQSRSPFLQCLPPTGRPHRQAHGSKKRILIRSRNQCQHPRTSSVAPPTALVLSRRSQDRPLLGSHHEVGSRPRRCRRLCSSRRIAFALAERCPHGYWFDLDPLVLCH